MPILHEHIEGKYEILGKLREGGMGAVYKVRHRLLDDVRVVKILNPRLDVTPELNDRFLREARFAIQLRHPNIAQLHDFSIADDGSAFIVMEFIDGATLEDIVARSGPPPLGLGLEMARQSLKAVGFLHRRGMIHRDISPDNLMLTRDAEGEPLVKLIDLGIAKVLKGGTGALTSTGMFLGKPRYASPEQFSATGLEGVDARADLYSFGVVLYELLTGVCPIQGRDPGSLMAGHLFRPPLDFAQSDPDGRLPADLRAILLRVLAKVPDERFATAEELARALGEVQNRFPGKPGEIDAILAKAALPVPTAPPPGSTQEKLDQQFAKVATPAPTLRSEPRRDSTLVLGSQERPAVPVETVAETMAMPREAVPAPVPEVVRSVPVAPVAARVEAPPSFRPPVRPMPPAPRRRSMIPLAAVLLVALVAVALGGWWFWLRGDASIPDASVTTTAQPPAPVAPVAMVSPPATQPAVAESAASTTPSVAPAAVEIAPSIAPPAPAIPKPVPVYKEPLAKKPARQPETLEPREAAARPAAPQPAPEREQPKASPISMDSVIHVQPPSASSAPQSEDLGAKTGDAVDVGAKLRSVPAPSFPAVYKGTGSYARILVSVHVDATGRVIDTRIANYYLKVGSGATDHGSQSFRDAAQEAARKARFEPAQSNGKPVPWWGELTFEFGKKPGS